MSDSEVFVYFYFSAFKTSEGHRLCFTLFTHSGLALQPGTMTAFEIRNKIKPISEGIS